MLHNVNIVNFTKINHLKKDFIKVLMLVCLVFIILQEVYMKTFTKWERVRAVLNGELADRPPMTAYRHFPKVERKPEDLAKQMLDWQEKYDFDIVKIHPAATYMQEVWGDEFDYSEYDGLFAKKIKSGTTTDDLSIFTVKDIDNPVLKDHIKATKMIKEGLKEDCPVLQTLFTPLQAISGVFDAPFVRRHFPADRKDNKIFNLIKNHKDELLKALENVTQTYINYWKGLKEAGADGMFYAGVSWARAGYMSYDEWETFIEYFDKKFCKAVQDDGGIVMYHTCGIKSNPQRFVDYPIDILHWDQGAENNPNIKESLKYLGKITPMGGVDEMIFGTNQAEKIAELTKVAVDENKNIPFILAPYCSVGLDTSEEEMKAFIKIGKGEK